MKSTTSTCVVCLAWSLGGLAGAEQYQALAPVLDVAPVYETRYEPVSREVCTAPAASVREFGDIAPTIGEDVRRQIRLWRQHQRCSIVTEQHPREYLSGYRVTYRYGGETEGTFRAILDTVFESADGRVVGLHHNVGQRNGRQLDTNCCIVFEVRDGRIASGTEHFLDLRNWDDFWS